MFVQKYICLSACAIFERYQWAWPGNHQPLHALTVLIKEVDRLGEDPIAARLRDLVDQTLALCGSRGGVVGGSESGVLLRPVTDYSQEVWRVLLRLRTKVWVKTGASLDVPLRRDIQAAAETRLSTILNDIDSSSGDLAHEPVSFEGMDLQESMSLWTDWGLAYDGNNPVL